MEAVPIPGLSTQPLPAVLRVRQQLPLPMVTEIEGTVWRELDATIGTAVRPGMRVAVTAGSRGIAGIGAVLRAVADWMRSKGAQPFVVAAMGSHGGATPSGQLAVLAGYGVTESSIGCRVVAEVETVEVGHTPLGCPTAMARAAWEADGVLVVNRVKPHSILRPPLGSGLMKMTALGLSGPRGADSIHSHGLEVNLIPAARILLASGKVLGGLALVENAQGRLGLIEGVAVADFEPRDQALLSHAREMMPTVPLDPLDVLVVKTIGKDISGAGMDPNVIGMHRRLGGVPEREIRRIVALGLSPRSEGNAIGVGVADIITQRLKDAIDWSSTYVNALTSDFLWGVKLPIAFPNDREAIGAALRPFQLDRVRAVFVQDTTHLETIYITVALEKEARAMPTLEIENGPEPLRFGAGGVLDLRF